MNHSDRYALPDTVRVPRGKPSYYVSCTHWAHRTQAARARRLRRDEEPWTSGARIFLYHRVSRDHDRLSVTPEAFRAQMELLCRTGTNPLLLEEAVAAVQKGLPGRHVCITFDDGYRDNLDHAIPVLRDLGIPATIFVISAVPDGGARLYWYNQPPPTLSWDDLREIDRDRLISIGSHTRSHPALDKLTDDAAWDEIAGSRRDLESRLGRPVTSFAYPAGRQGEREIRMARAAGYRLALACEPGVNGPRDDPHALRRTPVSCRDSLAMFEAKLMGLLDQPWGLHDILGLPTRLLPAPLARRIRLEPGSPGHAAN